MNDFQRILHVGLPLLLLVAVLYSVLALPLVKQQKIERLNALREQTDIRDKAQREWRRLLLEQATLTAPLRIEQLASTRLQMRIPRRNQLRELEP